MKQMGLASETRLSSLELKSIIYNSLVKEGFSILDDRVLSIPNDKEYIRRVNERAVTYLREKKRDFIEKYDDYIINKYIISGNEIDIRNIQPKMIPVNDKETSNIFMWTKLHWSIPISAGYGRRLRYLVYDKGNSALVGIIGLADPVYGMMDRDTFIGWDRETKRKRLKNVMDAFVLGAVPPYSNVLGGKLVSSLVASKEIKDDFRSKYRGIKSLISGEIFNGKLAAVTTLSAFGKSSVYDRIKIPSGPEFIHAGWTRGSGEFQFSQDIYEKIFEYMRNKEMPSKNPKWGTGIRNKRYVVNRALKTLNMPSTLLYHNIKREIFIIPLGKKSLKYLKGESERVEYYNLKYDEIGNYAMQRWVIPRSDRDKSYLKFKKENYSLMQ